MHSLNAGMCDPERWEMAPSPLILSSLLHRWAVCARHQWWRKASNDSERLFFKTLSKFLKMNWGASQGAQWLRIHLPMQGTWVRALVQEDPTCHGATKPMCHNYWACALEPASHNYWSPRATTTEACAPRACAPQQEKPPQWEAHAPQRRVAPARHN